MKKLVNTSRIAITTACLLCCVPQDALCASLSVERVALELASPDAFNRNLFDLVPALSIGTTCSQESPLINLAKVITESDDPLSTTKRFFELFLNHKGAHLSTSETCQLIRQNAHLIPREHHESLYLAINALESSILSASDSALQNLDSMACSLSWPWNWNWFGLNKKNKKPKHQTEGEKSKSLELSDWAVVVMFGCLVAGLVVIAVYNPAAFLYMGEAIKTVVQAVPVLAGL